MASSGQLGVTIARPTIARSDAVQDRGEALLTLIHVTGRGRELIAAGRGRRRLVLSFSLFLSF